MSRGGVDVDVRIASKDWRDVIASDEDLIARSINAAAKAADVPGGSVDVLLTSDDEMRALNVQWRGKDKPTDVLSFPSGEAALGTGSPFLGDIALGWGTCVRDAKETDTDMQAHLAHLTIHGFLHLVGYDHEESEAADVMEALEAKVLASLGYADPYERMASDAATQVR